MVSRKSLHLTRRQFIVSGSAALAATAVAGSRPSLKAEDRSRLKLALVGTGSRGTSTWGKPVVDNYSDVVQIVGLCDINGKRVKAAQALIGSAADEDTGVGSHVERIGDSGRSMTWAFCRFHRSTLRANSELDVATQSPIP